MTLFSLAGYQEIQPIKGDEFGRFHGIVSNKLGQRFYIKAYLGKKGYGYKSLYSEAMVTRYLSSLTSEFAIKFKGYRLVIPRVEKIIADKNMVCMVSNYIQGQRLLDQPDVIQAKLLNSTLKLLGKLSHKARRKEIQFYLKSYTKLGLLFTFPARLLKSIILSPSSLLELLEVSLKIPKLLKIRTNSDSLVHADINMSNIWFKDKTIYLTDWEEAGWGISTYNIIAPLCVHWENKIVRDKLIGIGLWLEMIPLLAYRILVLFNQKLPPNDTRRIRDQKLLGHIKKL